MMHDDLLLRAKAGVRGKRRIKTAYLRRSVSDAYYAVFHALAALCANSLIGSSKSQSQAWRRIYRSLQHELIRKRLSRPEAVNIYPSVSRIGAAFGQLQAARHSADYSPVTNLKRRGDAEILIAQAEAALSDIGSLPAEARLGLAAYLIHVERN